MHMHNITNAYRFDMRINIHGRPKVYAGLCRILRKAGCVSCVPFDGETFTGLYTFKPIENAFFSHPNWDRVLGQMTEYKHFAVDKGVVSLSMAGILTEDVDLVYKFLLWIEANLTPQMDEMRDRLDFSIFNGEKDLHVGFELTQRSRNGAGWIIHKG